MVKKGTGESKTVNKKAMRNLKDNTLVSDEFISEFSMKFNLRECQKRTNNPSYKPIHMFKTFLLILLCASRDRIDGYDAASADLHTRCKRKRKIDMNSDREGRQVMSAMNLFECRMIIFPLFESGIHYIFFAVDPMSLKQKVYDSLHGSLYDFDKDKD